MNDEKPNAVPFLEYVARYAEEFGNHAWAESLRHRLAGDKDDRSRQPAGMSIRDGKATPDRGGKSRSAG